MKVSVIIPTYRRESELTRAITSIKNQTYSDVEIIVVDDNANLEWNKKVKKIVDSFSDIIYIQNKENSGPAQTRNYGIDAASGEYITFLDDDDLYLPLKIEKQISAMQNCNADFSITDLDLYNSDGSYRSKRERNYIKSTDSDSLIKYHLMYHLTGTDTMMFKKSYLDLIGGFTQIDVGDEYYLMMKALQNGGKFCYVKDCYVKAFVHLNESVSNGVGKILGENALFEFKKKYFPLLKKSEINYICMRHHAVLAFVYLKEKKYFKVLLEALKGFVHSPVRILSVIKNRG